MKLNKNKNYIKLALYKLDEFPYARHEAYFHL